MNLYIESSYRHCINNIFFKKQPLRKIVTKARNFSKNVLRLR